MAQNNDSIAVMLLCCRMSATRQELFDPLSPQEYHALEQTLSKKLKTTPGWMFGRDIGELMEELGVTEQEAHRLVVLMERMVSLSYELDNYARHSIEIITCVDGEIMHNTRAVIRLSDKKVNFFDPDGCDPNATWRAAK